MVLVLLPRIVPTGIRRVLTLTLPLLSRFSASVELFSELILSVLKLPVVIVATIFSTMVPSVKNTIPVPGLSVPMARLP